MSQIQLTPDELRGKATELRGLKSEHDETMQKMRTLIEGLSQIWQGEAQNAYVEKYHSMQSQFTNFSEMLEGYAALMDTAANKMQETDLSLKGTMDGFGG